MNVSGKHQRPFDRVELDEWRIDPLSLMQIAESDDCSDDERMSELDPNNEETRFWIQAVIDNRTRLCLGLHIYPEEITPETIVEWKGKRQ